MHSTIEQTQDVNDELGESKFGLSRDDGQRCDGSLDHERHVRCQVPVSRFVSFNLRLNHSIHSQNTYNASCA